MAKRMTAKANQEQLHNQEQALLKAMASIANGNLDVEVVVPEGNGAFAELAAGLNTMIEELRAQNTEQAHELEEALNELEAVQRRYLHQAWGQYTGANEATQGYLLSDEADHPTDEAWLAVMATALEDAYAVTQTNGDGVAELGIPIRLHGEVIGVLGFAQAKSEGWSREEIAAVEEIVDQVGLILEAQRLFDQTQHALATTELQAQQLTLLNEMSQQLSQAGSVGDVYKVATQFITQLMQADRVSIALLNENGDAVQPLVLKGADIGFAAPDDQVSLAGTAMEVAIRENIVMVTPDTRISGWEGMKEQAEAGVLSIITVPLVIGGQVHGTLNLCSSEANTYTQQDEGVMLQVASLLATALENKRLLEERQRLATIVENHPDFVAVGTLEGKALYVNPAGLQMMGLPPDQDVSNMDAGDFYPPADAEILVKEGIPTALKQGWWTSEANLLKAGGITLPVEQTIAVNYDANRQPVSFSITMRDITDRLAAEAEHEALLEQLSQLTTIVETTSDFVSLMTLDQHQITYINLAGMVMIGQAGEDYRSLSQQDFRPPKVLEQLETEIYPAVLKDGIWTGELELLQADGCVVPTSEVIILIKDERGTSAALASIARDIAERTRSAETLSKRATELETVARVSAAASSILSPADLLQSVADLTKTNFNLYHAHIYLLNEEGDTLNLVAGAGDIGRQMVAEGRSIPLSYEQSLVARAARSKQGIIVNNVRHGSGFLPHPLLPNTKSELAVPMIVGDKVLGVLDVQADVVDRFSEEDVRLKIILASQLAIAIQNADLFEQAQESLNLTENLYNVGRHIAEAGGDYQEILAAVIEGVPFAAMDRAVLGMFERDENVEVEAMTIVASWHNGQGPQPTPVGTRYSRQVFTTINALLSSEPVFINDVKSDERVDANTLDVLQTRQIGAFAVLPLWAGKWQIGVLMLQSKEAYHFSQREIQPYLTLVRQMATAIENKRLLEQAQDRARREQILREVTSSVRGLVDREAIVRTTARELGHALNRPTFVVLPSARRTQSSNHDQLSIELSGYLFDLKKVKKVKDLPSEAIQEAITEQAQIMTLTDKGQSLVITPLLVQDESVGAIGIYGLAKEGSSSAVSSLVATISEQVALALESARLFEQTQTASILLSKRVKELDLLSKIGRKTEETQSIPEFLEWLTEQIPATMYHPALCAVAIEFEDQVYGFPEAVKLRTQITQGLRIRNQLVGRIYIAYREKQDFLDEESALLGGIGQRISSYIENRRLFEQTQAALSEMERQAHRLALLNEMSEALSQTSSVQDVFEVGVSKIAQIMGTDRVSLALVNKDGQSVDIVALEGETGAVPAGISLPIKGSDFERVIIGRELIVQHDNTHDTSLPGIRARMNAPLITRDRVIGSLNVGSKEVRVYGLGDQNLLQQIASLVASHIESRRLLELAQIRAERERRVRNITDKIRQSPDRETILRVAREEVGHILKASNSVAGVGTQAQLLSKLGQQTETDETDQVDDRAS